MYSFDITLVKEKTRGRVVLQIPLQSYMPFFIVSIINILSIWFTGGSLLSYIILLLTLSVLTYREQWVFDSNKRQITYKTGILFRYKKFIYSFNDVDLLESSFNGNNNLSLKIYLQSGVNHNIIHYKKSKLEEFNKVVNALEWIIKVERV